MATTLLTANQLVPPTVATANNATRIAEQPTGPILSHHLRPQDLQDPDLCEVHQGKQYSNISATHRLCKCRTPVRFSQTRARDKV
jgi:hypothetical protein